MRSSSVFLLATLAWGLLSSHAFAAQNSVKALPPAHEIRVRFAYHATLNEHATASKHTDLWLPLPSDSAYQKVTGLAVVSPFPYLITRERKFGNRMIYLHVDRPAQPIVVTVTFVVDRKPVRLLSDAVVNTIASAPVSSEAGRLLSPDARVPTGGRYAEIAHNVTRGQTTAMDRMHALYAHVIATMNYDYKKESPEYGQGDVAFVCDYKKGNCSDLHSYLISLARSLGIPAVLEYGFPISGVPPADPLPASGSIGGYHCWVWFQDPDHGWLPLDASDGRRWLDAARPDVKDLLFGNLITERSAVVMTHGRDIVLEPRQHGGPLNNFIYPYAEVDGVPIDAPWKLTFETLASSAVQEGAP